MEELKGTLECPICGWPEPHAHSQEEVAERPEIDGARIAFEKEAREFMASYEFKDLRTGYWWAFQAELARQADERNGIGWAHRDYISGPYTHRFVEVFWQFWKMAWMSAKGRPLARKEARDEET